MYDIVLGRSPADAKKLGTKGAVMIGKQYVQMGQSSSLSNPIYLDVSRAHAMLIVGKRGGGKCLVKGTDILMSDETKREISGLYAEFSQEKNRVGSNEDYFKADKDLFVKSFDLEKKEFVNKRVTHVYRRKIKEDLIKWKFNPNSYTECFLISTQDHKILGLNAEPDNDELFWTTYRNHKEIEYFVAYPQKKLDKEMMYEGFWTDQRYGNLGEEDLVKDFEGYVYDLTVEDTHNFVANGIVVHNSYTMGSIAEGLADMDPEISKNLAFVMLDTMGVYWSMKYPNEKEDELLSKWGLEGKGLNVQIYVPGGFYEKYKEDGVPVDFPFYIKPNELSAEDWLNAFKLETDNPVGVAIQRVIGSYLGTEENFSINDIISKLEDDTRVDDKTKYAAINRFENAKTWGIFSKNGTPIKELLRGGVVTVMDLSPYVAMPGGWDVKSLALGIIAKKIFVERMLVRKREELYDIVNKTQVVKKEEVEEDLPMPWLIVDECLPGDSKIETEKGRITIGEIFENNMCGLKVQGINTQSNKLEYHEITKVYEKGEREVIKLKTETGKEIECTPDHKIYSKEGFIEAQKAQNIAIPLINQYSINEKLVTARLIGHIYGDGWMSQGKQKQVGFSSNSDEINLRKIKEDLYILGFSSGEIFSRQTQSIVKISTGVENKIIGNSYSVKASTRAFEYFKKLGVHIGSKVNIETLVPDYIMNSTKEEKSEFLSSLFGADANIMSQSNKWKSDFNPIRLVFYREESLESNGFEYGEQIKSLLRDLEVEVSSFKQRRGNIRKDNSKSVRFELTIAKNIDNMIRFLENISYKYSIQKEKTAAMWLSYLKKRQRAIFVKEEKRKEVLELRNKTGWGKIKLSKESNIPDYQIREWIYYRRKSSLSLKFPSFKSWISDKVFGETLFENIESKENTGIKKVYDISVDKIHNFVAEGFIVHNCHEFLPAGDETAPSKQALMTILREGRQPGVSLVMATQQPAKIHTDAITQSDIVLAHRLTASFDLEALDKIFLSYNSKGSRALFNSMPRTKGCAIIMDDKNERLHTMQVKPRFSWHGGEDPNAIREVKDEFDLE